MDKDKIDEKIDESNRLLKEEADKMEIEQANLMLKEAALQIKKNEGNVAKLMDRHGLRHAEGAYPKRDTTERRGRLVRYTGGRDTDEEDAPTRTRKSTCSL